MATMLIKPLVLTEHTHFKTQLAMQKKDEPTSRLMLLPLNIRRIIYGYALISSEPIEIHALARRNSVSSHSPDNKRSNLPRVSLLLQTCSRIRKEAAPIYYGSNIFVLPWGFPGLGCRWLDSLAPSHRRSLRDVRFCFGDGAFNTTYDAKVALFALETALKKSGSYPDLQDAVLRVPVCDWSVFTWTDLYDREDANWVSDKEIIPIKVDRGTGLKM
ncbi:uncharacterized protein RCC_09265 [Ramularia collo-cygni]|uniref:Uncharacterized protein n=1 Tax=Ramularia collo-cygni TaxID=112498 RepID=A0A2D3VH91_9PEZI|nr:uncharacterized protein RCC_09265 [Ramularia collo-cygni]CZT23551.1 uncharacterized protein RCC_09265 [Ramularia collo-cygni]